MTPTEMCCRFLDGWSVERIADVTGRRSKDVERIIRERFEKSEKRASELKWERR